MLISATNLHLRLETFIFFFLESYIFFIYIYFY